MVEIKGTLKVDLVYQDGVPKLTKGNQLQVVMEFTGEDGNHLMTLRGARLDGRLEVFLPILSGDHNQFIVSRYAPVLQEKVLQWARKVREDEGWTIEFLKENRRGR
ncbi:hypothetical protein LCGC14_1670210 [marine sediment metagenome]|uniref:Uncharacterized protein n=1 Tax=marine sediment metagenome TaxID=412755 RepID=A0A0F9KRF1_9ZZZZ